MKNKKENKVKAAFVVTTAILALISMLPVMASAQTNGDININEIMYNPPGADKNHEWLEIYNKDTTDINITDWGFFEADTNHRLTLVQGNMTIPVGGYAIIADNATAFLHEHPQCTCTVIDSLFSLRNTEEYIALKNATEDTIDEVTYNASWGADENGKTLELNATGGWEESRVDGGTPCQRNSVLGIPPMVTNASANPPVIAVNTDITELRVDAAGIESPIDVVTVDLSPIGGNASTVMFNIGNYTKDNISWTMYNYTTNASVEGTFNLTVNATDINGNYNDTVNITLDVKKAVIQFSMIPPGTTTISNITVDELIPTNVGQNATMVFFGETADIDSETYYVVTTTKPVGGAKIYTGVNFATEDITQKREVVEGEPGVEIANLTYDPAYVMFDYPLWLGKTWTATVNVTGTLNVNGTEIPVNTTAVIKGNVTEEVYLSVPYGTDIHSLVVEVNVSLQDLPMPMSCLQKYWQCGAEDAILPKYQRYLNGDLMEEFELIEVKKTVIHFPTFQAMSYISNISFDANIPDNVGKNATTEQFTSTEVIDNETYYVVNTTKPVGSTKMYVGVDEVNEDLTMKRRVRERESGVEVANLTFDPEFVSRDFPLWFGKNWTTITNVTGMLVNRTGTEIPIDSIAVVSGEVTDEVDLTVPYGTIHCLVVEVNVNLQDPPVSFLTRYWMDYDEIDEMLIIPKSQRYSNENLMEELELIEIVAP